MADLGGVRAVVWSSCSVRSAHPFTLGAPRARGGDGARRTEPPTVAGRPRPRGARRGGGGRLISARDGVA